MHHLYHFRRLNIGEEEEDGISKHEGCKPIVKESKNGGVGAKNTKPQIPIVFTPDSLGQKELNVGINTGTEKEAVMNDQLEETLNTDKTEGEDSQDPIEGSSQSFNFTDSYSNNFKKKFIWSSRFLERESRRKDRKPVSKKTEHSSKMKSKFKEDRSQTRMDKYLKEIDDNLALSTSSLME